MTENKTKHLSSLTEATVELIKAVPLYNDAIQPVAKQVGTALESTGQLLNTALRPLRSIALTGDLLFDNVDKWLKARFENVPNDKITEPPIHTAGPLMLGLSFTEDGSNIRHMFLELLAKSMHKDYRDKVHPSFVNILQSLDSFEAHIIHSFKESMVKERYSAAATITYYSEEEPGILNDIYIYEFITIELAQHFEKIHRSMLNLQRLGILETYHQAIAGPYDKIEECAHYLEAVEYIKLILPEGTVAHLTWKPISIRATSFGVNFINCCINENWSY